MSTQFTPATNLIIWLSIQVCHTSAVQGLMGNGVISLPKVNINAVELFPCFSKQLSCTKDHICASSSFEETTLGVRNHFLHYLQPLLNNFCNQLSKYPLTLFWVISDPHFGNFFSARCKLQPDILGTNWQLRIRRIQIGSKTLPLMSTISTPGD